MNLQTAEKIIDELTKGKEKLRTKKIDDDSIFIKYGSLRFLCDFEKKKLQFLFKVEIPANSLVLDESNSLFENLNKFQEPYVELGYRVTRMDFIYIPKNEEEIKSVLEQILEQYS